MCLRGITYIVELVFSRLFCYNAGLLSGAGFYGHGMM